jgi:dTDP-4-dehydrorhamnose reductase
MKTILVTGANGQIGRELQEAVIDYADFEMIAADRELLDITDEDAMKAYFDDNQIDICINCAAYTAVDKAEENAEQAYLINKTAVGNLATICKEKNIQFIHFSTDYVYHNDQNHPFKEEDETTPKSVYAVSKLEGEQLAFAKHPECMIIRTSWVYSYYGHNFVKTMLRLGAQRDNLSVVFDQIGTPTYAYDIAHAVLKILSKEQSIAGLYHYSNEGVTSWYDFAVAIFEINELSCQVAPIESKDYPTPAKRPHFSVLNKEKIKNTFQIDIPHWRTSLKHCLNRLQVEGE